MGSGKEASTARRVHTWSVFSRVVVADTYPFNSGDQRELGRKWDGLPAPQSGGDFDTPCHLPPRAPAAKTAYLNAELRWKDA